MQAKPIAQASFDTFYFEMIKYIQNQYDPEAYIATGKVQWLVDSTDF